MLEIIILISFSLSFIYLQRYFSDCSLVNLETEVGNPGMITFCSSPQRLLRFLLRSAPSSWLLELFEALDGEEAEYEYCCCCCGCCGCCDCCEEV